MAQKNALIDRWFHAYTAKGKLTWQGQVLGQPSKGVYLVQLYEWLMGGASDQKLVPFKRMTHWQFYDTAEDMRAAHRDYLLKRGEFRAAEGFERSERFIAAMNGHHKPSAH